MKKALLALGLLFSFSGTSAERGEVIKHLTDTSVTVRANSGYSRSEGSATLFKRKVWMDDNSTRMVVFALSAAHVVSHLRSTRDEITKDGKPRKVVEYSNPQLVRKLRNPDTGRIVGEVVVDAKIIKYSDADTGHDLVIMQVLADDFELKRGAVMYPKDGKLIPVGTHMFHVGSLMGDGGAGSLTDGILSAHGRLLHGKIELTQSTLVAFPGSSGGGCFLDDGRLVGVLVRGTPTQGFNLHVPTKRLWRFAEKSKTEWLFDHSIKVTQSEIDDLLVEDTAGAGGSKSNSKSYPFLIRRELINQPK